MMIDLSLVDYNPYRDLELDPIDSERVASLASSIDGSIGFWGGLAVRKNGDRYQLAFGHHRFEALKSLGWKEADLNVVDCDDDDIVQVMYDENALQRNGLQSVVEAVGAAIRVLGPMILRGDAEALGKALKTEGYETGATNVAPVSLQTIAELRKVLLKGNGLGEHVLRDYFKGKVPIRDIRASLEFLRQSGKIREYLGEMSAPEEAIGKAKGRLIDPAVLQIFDRNKTVMLRGVCAVLSSESGQGWIPMEDQVPVVTAIRDQIVKDDNREVTADEMKLWLNSYRGHLAQLLRQMEESATPPERQKADEITRNFNALTAGVGRVTDAATFLQGKAEAGEPLPLSKDDFHGFFKNDVRLMNESIAALAQALRVDEVESIVSIQ